MRIDGRMATQLRPVIFQTHYIDHHPGSVLVSFGKTRVLVTATIENKVPQYRQEANAGWLTAEYGMLPGSTIDRKARPGNRGPDGRAIEIQRLIGRSLRQAINLKALGPKSITIDCDVIQADGGTRTAAITGGYVALMLCLHHFCKKGDIKADLNKILVNQVAAVSLGILDSEILTDLSYEEDVRVDTDFNIIATNDGRVIELQGTAEREPMLRGQVDTILEQGLSAVSAICVLQNEAIRAALS